MTRFVALLRAINTPPRHVKMECLRTILRDAGFRNVETYIASGNVIFDARPASDLTGNMEAALSDGLGFDVPVYLRTATEFLEIAARDPFDGQAGSLEISFLPGTPDPVAVRSLVDTASGTDRLAVAGREVYWLHDGPRVRSPHKESTVVRLLGMPTTQRSATTVRTIADRYLR